LKFLEDGQKLAAKNKICPALMNTFIYYNSFLKGLSYGVVEIGISCSGKGLNEEDEFYLYMNFNLGVNG
jgi:hypothetical protein